ncbi:gluconate 2-dehydrogenase subunit 3 family protein [Shewanella colwelliana]|uniref:gluconate 2-dehydrogenase subunit 3 family protein n=1 Tax=Shewanella colwelliana TaxID=23 RepID=UPI0037354AF5
MARITRQHLTNKGNMSRYAYASGMSRRAFLQKTGAGAALLALIGIKPVFAGTEAFDRNQVVQDRSTSSPRNFDVITRAIVETVQLHLFPDDGDGPSAQQLNAYTYLLWAIDEPDNQADGDRPFVIQGASWLEELSQEELGTSFLLLDETAQDNLLQRVAKSRAGENWLSLLLYYLLEALTLDPIYGGNPQGIGWQWLEYQPGFPRPTVGKTYLDF